MASLTVKVEGKTYNVDDFKLGELVWAEDQIGMDIEEATTMKQAAVFVALIKRRDNPKFTYEDALNLDLTVFDEAAADAPPTKPAAKSKAKAA